MGKDELEFGVTVFKGLFEPVELLLSQGPTPLVPIEIVISALSCRPWFIR
ncbi:hypothetical protein ES708_21035 [subsurface metagenome]